MCDWYYNDWMFNFSYDHVSLLQAAIQKQIFVWIRKQKLETRRKKRRNMFCFEVGATEVEWRFRKWNLVQGLPDWESVRERAGVQLGPCPHSCEDVLACMGADFQLASHKGLSLRKGPGI